MSESNKASVRHVLKRWGSMERKMLGFPQGHAHKSILHDWIRFQAPPPSGQGMKPTEFTKADEFHDAAGKIIKQAPQRHLTLILLDYVTGYDEAGNGLPLADLARLAHMSERAYKDARARYREYLEGAGLHHCDGMP